VGSALEGFLFIDKPGGWTSHDVVARARSLLGVRRIGHAGTLDPMATGLLVLGVGRATRLLRFVQAAPKQYEARAVFGVATDTLDADGAVLERTPMDIDEEDVQAVLSRFVGTVLQVPPMVSALRVGGRRLYDLARQGLEVEREPRPVRIHELELTDFAPGPYPEVAFRVRCGSGTFVRTLADDIAGSLGGRAHLVELRRTAIGSIDVAGAVTMDAMERAAEDGTLHGFVVPAAAGLRDLPIVTVDDATAEAVGNGAVFPAPALAMTRPGEHAVVDASGRLLAVYRSDGRRAVPEVVLP
jgi:tRNA pseudouridine55 synthase